MKHQCLPTKGYTRARSCSVPYCSSGWGCLCPLVGGCHPSQPDMPGAVLQLGKATQRAMRNSFCAALRSWRHGGMLRSTTGEWRPAMTPGPR